ncbi:hypothetical protein, partial [Streptomyces resistomycificus]|uniref:hypothetical protein n=1 Tax=Streptomyces resistomycificus TaxID=67356 RepID=UPI001AE02146
TTPTVADGCRASGRRATAQAAPQAAPQAARELLADTADMGPNPVTCRRHHDGERPWAAAQRPRTPMAGRPPPFCRAQQTVPGGLDV